MRHNTSKPWMVTEYGTHYNKTIGNYKNYVDAHECVKMRILEFSKMHPEFQATYEDFDDDFILAYNLSNFKGNLMEHWEKNFSGCQVMYPSKEGEIYPYFEIKQK